MTSDPTQRVRVEEIDWTTVLPIARGFGAFRTAICLPNLLIALLLVVTLWLLGQSLDLAFGSNAYQGEISQYANLPLQSYEQWIDRASQKEIPQVGIFETAMAFKLNALRRFAIAAVKLQFLSTSLNGNQVTIVDSIRDLLVILPGWLWTHHRSFMLLYGSIALAVWALLGGAIVRTAALQATKNQRITVIQAIRYAGTQWTQFVLTPLLPFFLASMVGLIPMAFGAALFNVPGLDIIGGLTLIGPIVFSAVITIFLALAVVTEPLLYPALAVEDTDCFDAISRAFSYVLGRPWQWLSYNLVMWVYGAVTCLLVGLLICLTLAVAHWCVGLGVIREVGINQLDAIFSCHQDGNVSGTDLSMGSKVTVVAATLWVRLTAMMLGAYAVSFYFSANTWIYLLLRRSADRTEINDIFIDDSEQAAVSSEPSSNDSV